MKRRSSEQKLNLCAKESDKRIVSEGRRQKRRGLCKRLLGAVCLLFGEDSRTRREELNFNKN